MYKKYFLMALPMVFQIFSLGAMQQSISQEEKAVYNQQLYAYIFSNNGGLGSRITLTRSGCNYSCVEKKLKEEGAISDNEYCYMIVNNKKNLDLYLVVPGVLAVNSIYSKNYSLRLVNGKTKEIINRFE